MRPILEALRPGLVLASHNAGKLAEMRDLVAPLGVPVSAAGDHGLPEPEETGDSFLANARLKAEAARAGTGLAAVGDDSGLVVPSIGGRPGIHSARWAGRQRDFSLAMRRLVSVIVLALPDGGEEVFEGRVDGTLVWPPRGEQGFGYDPMFVPAGENRTFAEMPFAAKQGYSHRGQALRALVARIAGG